jgi:hypothetical protein
MYENPCTSKQCILCEFDLPRNKPNIKANSLPTLPDILPRETHIAGPSLLSCPAGHLTHAFLLCHKRSACEHNRENSLCVVNDNKPAMLVNNTEHTTSTTSFQMLVQQFKCKD